MTGVQTCALPIYLEKTAWDEAAGDLVSPLRGLPYVRVRYKEAAGPILTNSILEAHRLNSPYILEGGDKTFFARLKSEIESFCAEGGEGLGAVNMRQVAKVILRYDPNSLLHGLFLAKKELAKGRLKLPRIISGFIEARDVRPAESGGVKNDRVNPSGETKTGYGNVPFHRTEYVARSITAFFSLDLTLMRSYGLGESVENLLTALAFWKIQTLLDGALRLRTACDLTCESLKVTAPKGYTLPMLENLTNAMQGLIASNSAFFAQPQPTEVVWDPVVAKAKAKDKPDEEDENEEG